MSSFLKTSYIHDETAPSGSLVLLLKRSFSRQHHLHFFLVFSQVPRLSPRIVCFALGLLQRQTGIAGNVSIYKLLITIGWRTVWTRFSDNRFSKKLQLSRHHGPHRTKKKFSHAICLCLVRVHKVHVLYIARVQSCSLALWRSDLVLVDELLHQRSTITSATRWWSHAPPRPCPGALCEGLTGSPTVDLRGQLIGVWAVTERDACARSKLRKFLRNQFSFFVENVRFVIFHPKLALPPPPVSKCVTFRKKLRTYEMLPYNYVSQIKYILQLLINFVTTNTTPLVIVFFFFTSLAPSEWTFTLAVTLSHVSICFFSCVSLCLFAHAQKADNDRDWPGLGMPEYNNERNVLDKRCLVNRCCIVWPRTLKWNFAGDRLLSVCLEKNFKAYNSCHSKKNLTLCVLGDSRNPLSLDLPSSFVLLFIFLPFFLKPKQIGSLVYLADAMDSRQSRRQLTQDTAASSTTYSVDSIEQRGRGGEEKRKEDNVLPTELSGQTRGSPVGETLSSISLLFPSPSPSGLYYQYTLFQTYSVKRAS